MSVSSDTWCGYLYCCGRTPHYLRNAVQSALTVRKADHQADICLFHSYSNRELRQADLNVFNRIARLEIEDHLPSHFDPLMAQFLGKIQALIQSPFEVTLFLDADTRVLAPVSELFALMERFDIAVAPAVGSQKPQDSNDIIHKIPESFPEPNTGVILVRRNERTGKFLELWKKAFRDNEQGLFRQHGKGGEQVSLRHLLWSSPEIRTHFLISDGIPSIYNFRWKENQVFNFGRRIKIHHHGSASAKDPSVGQPLALSFPSASVLASVQHCEPCPPASYREALALFDSICKAKRDHFFFVQIGANDGVTCDPLHQYIASYRWRGILVEPVRHLFDRLLSLYRDTPELVLENVAIATSNGTKPFYYFPEPLEQRPDFPWWAKGMGSLLGAFDSPGNRLLAQSGFKMVEEPVSCLTLDSLLKRHSAKSIDLLQIDAEGFDGEIIRSIDFTRCQPAFIRYEERHIQRVFEQGLSRFSAGDIVSYLESAGYRVFSVGDGFDRFCARTPTLLS